MFIPGMHLSGNTVTKLHSSLGKNSGKRKDFFVRRLGKVSGFEHIAFDGPLKQDSSIVNDLSDFSYKPHLKGCRDVSVIYAYDTERMVPLYAQVFPGNFIDASAYREFIRENKIEKGIIVTDKDDPSSKFVYHLNQLPGLHFLTLVCRNDLNIEKLDLLKFDGVLTGTKQQVLYVKCKSACGRFFDSFKDTGLESSEHRDYLNHRLRHNGFNNENYQEKKEELGLIDLESDLDLPAKSAYLCYQDRRLLELMFKKYESNEQPVYPGLQTNFSVLGSEFVNFLATVITSRMVKKAEEKKSLGRFTYDELIDELEHIWRKTSAKGPVQSSDSYWVHPFKDGKQILEELGLSEPIATLATGHKTEGRPKKKPVFVGPKRPRGRPRKTETA